MQEIELDKLGQYVDPLVDFPDRWALVTTQKDGEVRTLTVSWGTLGFLWRRRVAMIFIRPSRYTNDFLKEDPEFTLTFFDGMKEQLTYLGRTSARDVPDKIARSGLTPIEVDGRPTFKEGRLIILCRTLYADQFERGNFVDKAIDDELNPDGNRNIVYIAEIEKAYLL